MPRLTSWTASFSRRSQRRTTGRMVSIRCRTGCSHRRWMCALKWQQLRATKFRITRI